MMSVLHMYLALYIGERLSIYYWVLELSMKRYLTIVYMQMSTDFIMKFILRTLQSLLLTLPQIEVNGFINIQPILTLGIFKQSILWNIKVLENNSLLHTF